MTDRLSIQMSKQNELAKISEVDLLVLSSVNAALDIVRSDLQKRLKQNSETIEAGKLTPGALAYMQRSELQITEALERLSTMHADLVGQYWQKHWSTLKEQNQ